MRIELQYFDGCPSWQPARTLLSELAEEFGFTLELRRIDGPEEAERLGFRGSPTVLIDGRDPFAVGDEPVGLTCRVYPTERGLAGVPSRDQLRAAIDEHRA